MTRRRRRGQHFLNSSGVARTMVSEARITRGDTVYEVGTGRGALTPLLCEKAGRVISAEADRELFEGAAASLAHIPNLTLQFGDGFRKGNAFSVFVSSLPYSSSRRAMEWLAQTPFSHGVVMVQEEFARKILRGRAPGRRAVGVIANHAMEITRISSVGRANFDPPPAVDSALLRIRKKATVGKALVQAVNRIFSYRRKTVQNVLRQFGMETVIAKRLDDLSDEEIIGIAREAIGK